MGSMTPESDPVTERRENILSLRGLAHEMEPSRKLPNSSPRRVTSPVGPQLRSFLPRSTETEESPQGPWDSMLNCRKPLQRRSGWNNVSWKTNGESLSANLFRCLLVNYYGTHLTQQPREPIEARGGTELRLTENMARFLKNSGAPGPKQSRSSLGSLLLSTNSRLELDIWAYSCQHVP